MKLPQNISSLLVWLMLVATQLSNIDGRRRIGCSYTKKGTDGACDKQAQTKWVELKLRSTQSDPACNPTIYLNKPCDDFSVSEQNNQVQQMPGRKVCKYKIEDFGDCDPITKKKTVNLRLIINKSPQNCARTRVDRKPCDFIGVCKWKILDPGTCDASTSTQFMTYELIAHKSNPSCVKSKVVSKPCHAKVIPDCQYTITDNGTCDTSTDTRQVTLQVVGANPPQGCIRSKVMSESCFEASADCNYNVVDNGTCDGDTHTRQVTFQIIGRMNPQKCVRTKVMIKRCVPSSGWTCTDLTPKCHGWAREGYCRGGTHAHWMNNNCKRSCNTNNCASGR